MTDIIGQMLHRQAEMEAVRGNWESMWEAVARLVLPRSDDFRSKHSPGTQRNQRQYDAFPMQALDKFAAAIESGLIPRTETWTGLSTGDEDLDEQHEVKLYLEDHNKMLWDTRYSPKANFSSQAHEKLLALGAFGTGCMLVEPRANGGVQYKAIHLSEVYIDESWEGVIDTVHRKFALSARQVVQLFGDDTPEKIMARYTSGNHNDKFEFLHCVMPRDDQDRTRMDAKGLPFAGYYVFSEGKQIVKEEGYHEMPYIVSRYTVSSREKYGRGPAIQLLPDISMLQEMRRTTIEAANMAVDPPTLLHGDDISEFDLTPGARNYGALDEQGRALAAPWNPGVDVRLGMDMITDVRDQIDDGFLGVYFRVLVDNPQMTATQAMLIAQQQGQMTAPPVGRLQTEWLGPMVRRESGIMFRQGRHNQMPEVLRQHLESKGESLKIKYTSPLTRAARSGEAVSILRTFESLAPIAQIDPSIYQAFDTKEVARIVADVNGVPTKAMKDPAQMEAEQEAEEAQAMMGNVLDAAPIAAQTAKTLAEAQAMSGNNPALN